MHQPEMTTGEGRIGMDTGYAPWVDHWLDAYDHDIPAILADNARALELDDPGDLPAPALALFTIDLEALRSDPEWAARRLQAGYAATFRVIQEMLGTKTHDAGEYPGETRAP